MASPLSTSAQVEVVPPVMSCGDPAGIGPELAAALLRDPSAPRFAWLGDPRHLPKGTAYELITTPAEASRLPQGVMGVIEIPFAKEAVAGQPDPANAQGVIAAIERGVALVQAGAASAIVTAPIAKSLLKAGAGFAYPGHTEFLAHLGGVDDVVMMLACAELKVVPITIHIPLLSLATELTPARIESTLRITHAALQRDFAIDRPRLAVAGLNPHAGESGTMGREEIELIAPVLERLRAEGMEIAGPLPADTMFHPAARARYDVALCMYHDQALIPIKTIDFSSGVNVTLGLPFVRTSPDHGTAFDIAGRGIADPSSLRAALDLAVDLAQRRAATRDRKPQDDR